MTLVNLVIGCVALLCAGSALRSLKYTKKRKLTVMAVATLEACIGVYFLIAAIGATL